VESNLSRFSGKAFVCRSYAFVIGGFAIFLVACDGKVHLTDAKTLDFARSEIISNGPAVADGASELLVVVHLMNSDGSSIPLFKPTYEITSGGGVQGSECTTSNNNGVATCVLKSTQAGTKRFLVTNVKKVELAKDLFFISQSPPGAVTGLVTAANDHLTSASGHTLSGTVGSLHSDTVKTSGGWKLYGGPEGSALSWK
jgi:hypothetical protein